MAQTTTISQKELKRQAELVFEGKTLKVMLCNVGATGYTEESTVANWQSVELSGNGYARYSQVLSVGAYDSVSGTYKLPDVNAVFTASASYSYNRVILYIDGQVNIHSMITESPNITLATGQTQTYVLSIRQDN